MPGYTSTTDLPKSRPRWDWDLYAAIERWMIDHVTAAIGQAPTIEVAFRDDIGPHEVHSVAEAKARTEQERTIPTSLELLIGGAPPTTSDRPCTALRIDTPTFARVFFGHPDVHQSRAWKTEFDAWLARPAPSTAVTASPGAPILGAAASTISVTGAGAHLTSAAARRFWNNPWVVTIIGGIIVVILLALWTVLTK